MPRKDSRFISQEGLHCPQEEVKTRDKKKSPLQSLFSSRPALSSLMRANRKEDALQSPQSRQIYGHSESRGCGYNVLLTQCEGGGKGDLGRLILLLLGTGLSSRPSFTFRASYNHYFCFTNEDAET